MTNRRRYFCGTPSDRCTGIGTDFPGKQHHKVHATREAAFKCYSRYLLSHGYTKIGEREFRPPDGGPIEVLPKRSHFGGEAIGGKRGGKEGGAVSMRRCAWKRLPMGVIAP